MPQNKISISVGEINLKPANTTFLHDFIWTRYSEQLSKLQQTVVGFLADYNKHPVIKIGYKASVEGDATIEDFEMKVGDFAPVQVAVVGKSELNYTATREANDRESVFAVFDKMAADFKNVMYESKGVDLISQSLFHPVRSLLGSIMSTTQDVSIITGLDVNPWGQQFEMVVFCHDDTDFQSGLRILIRSPKVEPKEA